MAVMRCRFLAPSCVALTRAKIWLPSKLRSPRPVTPVQTVRPLFSSGMMNYNCCSRDVSDESADTESEESMDSGGGKTADEKTLNPKDWQEIVRSYSRPMTSSISSFMPTEKLSSGSSLPSRQEESMVGDGQTALQQEEDYSLEKLLRNVQRARLREERTSWDCHMQWRVRELKGQLQWLLVSWLSFSERRMLGTSVSSESSQNESMWTTWSLVLELVRDTLGGWLTVWPGRWVSLIPRLLPSSHVAWEWGCVILHFLLWICS